MVFKFYFFNFKSWWRVGTFTQNTGDKKNFITGGPKIGEFVLKHYTIIVTTNRKQKQSKTRKSE